ncbi:hypothetical protein [Brevibacillus dissolubilis]|uniref:hypothetical protein n=1 Tax=Brevibacillus dissolubilis TaxID=1844116 RepID=UPI0011169327|nr:hypothetical protein [Brevibacillus dissolubilis]
MKKTTLIVYSSLAILLGIGSGVGVTAMSMDNHQHGAALLVPGYQTVDELTKNTNTIMKAQVSGDYEEVETAIPDEKDLYTVSRAYKLTVEKAFKDEAGNKYKKGDVVELLVPVGVTQKVDGKNTGLLPIFDEQPKLEEGEYLLYLTSAYSKQHGKKVLMLSNYHHIYKNNSKNKGAANSASVFENIASDKVPTIDEATLISE